MPGRLPSLKTYSATICFSMCVLAGQAAFAGQPITLSQVVEKALQNNPNVLAQSANEQAAKHRVEIAQAGYLPTVSLTMGRGYERTETPAIAQEKLHRAESAISLSQPIFDGLGAYHQIKSRDSLYKFAQFDTLATEEDTALSAIEAMLNVIQAKHFVSQGQVNVDKHRDTLKKARARFKAGAGHQGDLSLVEGRLARAQSTLSRLKREYRDAQATYKQIVGEEPGHFHNQKAPNQLLPKDLDMAVSLAMEHSPVLKAQQATLSASRYDIKTAKASFLPSVSLELRVSNNSNLDGVRGDNQDRTAMLQVAYNLFNGGADLAAVREAQAVSVNSQMTLDNTRRALIEKVTREWNLYEISKERLASLKMHVDSSTIVLKAYKNEFKIGRRQILNVLDQENELFQSQIEYRRGLTTYVRSIYRVLASIGTLVENTKMNSMTEK